MTTADRINSFYNEYKADFAAAKQAQAGGNLPAARILYRKAAKALLQMAELESGEVKKTRVNHAEDILRLADNLVLTQSAAPVPTGTPSPQNPQPAAQKDAVDGNDADNPWLSEGIPDTSFDDVVGMNDVKQLIRTGVIEQIRHPELYKSYALQGGTGILMFGLPGTGKTTMARAIAHEVNAPLFVVNLSDVLSKWVGESERRIKQLFEKARQSECAILFFDDFDALGQLRQDDGNHNNKVIVELINQMDGFRKNTNTIVLLAATNRPWMVDPALMRPGRLEHHIYIPLPDEDARLMLIHKTLKNAPVAEDVDLQTLSQALEGCNGADVVSVVNIAKRKAVARAVDLQENGVDDLSPVTQQDFMEAAKEHRSSVVPDDIQRMRAYALSRGIALPDKM